MDDDAGEKERERGGEGLNGQAYRGSHGILFVLCCA